MIKILTDQTILAAISGGATTCKCVFNNLTSGVSQSTFTKTFHETSSDSTLMIRCMNICSSTPRESSISGYRQWYTFDNFKRYCPQSEPIMTLRFRYGSLRIS